MKTIFLLILFFSLSLIGSCSKDTSDETNNNNSISDGSPSNQNSNKTEDTDEKSSEPAKSIYINQGLPRFQGINLSKLGQKISPKASPKASPKISPKLLPSLTPTGELDHCLPLLERKSDAYILAGLCAVSSMLSVLYYGQNGGDFNEDGEVNCHDLESSNGQAGELLAALCSKEITNNEKVIEIGFVHDPEREHLSTLHQKVGAVSFKAAAENPQGVGMWDRGGTNSYPMNLRYWHTKTPEQTFDDLLPIMGMTAEDPFNSDHYILNPTDLPDAEMHLFIRNADNDFAKCLEEPNSANCVSQEVSIDFGSGLILASSKNMPLPLFNSSRAKLWSDDYLSPSLFIFEGKYSFEEGSAGLMLKKYPLPSGIKVDLSTTREMYFQFIQKEDETWSKIIFLDENGDVITLDNSSHQQELTLLGEGFCEVIGEDGSSCAKLMDTSFYNGFFKDHSTFAGTKIGGGVPLSIDFSNPPKKVGVALREKELSDGK